MNQPIKTDLDILLEKAEHAGFSMRDTHTAWRFLTMNRSEEFVLANYAVLQKAFCAGEARYVAKLEAPKSPVDAPAGETPAAADLTAVSTLADVDSVAR